MSTTTLYFDLDFTLFSGPSGSCANDTDRDLVVTGLRTSSENSAAHVSNVTVASVICLIDTENIQGLVTSSVKTLTLQGHGFVGSTSLYVVFKREAREFQSREFQSFTFSCFQ